MKKILFLGRFPEPVHGAAVINENYFKSLARNNFEVERIKINYSHSIDKLGSFGLNKMFYTISLPFRLINKLVNSKPDLIYFELAPNGLAFYRDSILILICKLFNKKILFHLHARNIARNIYSNFIFKNTKIIILSNILYNEVDKLFDKKDVYILPNGIKDELNELEFKRIIKERKKEKTFNILFISNINKEKGALEALKIFNNIKNKEKFRLYFVGPWQDFKFKKEWEEYIIRNKLQNRCIYLGKKYGADKNKVLRKTNLVLFPTSYKNESFPLVTLESFMFGVPVFAYDNGAIKEIISKDYLGEVFNKNENNIHKKIANSIEKLSKSNIDYKRIRKHFRDNYTLQKIEKDLIKILNKEI